MCNMASTHINTNKFLKQGFYYAIWMKATDKLFVKQTSKGTRNMIIIDFNEWIPVEYCIFKMLLEFDES